jgi:GATA-binding protein 2
MGSTSTGIVYMDSPIHSPYTQSPQMDSNFVSLPYSPSFSPLESPAHLEPEFGFPTQAIGLSLHNKHWAGRVERQIYETPSLPTSPGWPRALLPFDSNSWNDIIMSALDADARATPSPSISSQYTSPDLHPHLLPCSSPSPSGSSAGSLSPDRSPARTRRESADSTPGGKSCSHCNATSTPLWRRDPTTHRPLCNACGLYLLQRNKMRPAALIAADQCDDEADPDDGAAPGAPECSHCHTHRTSVWRRSKSGAKLCNACGVYARLRGRDRPLSLRRNKIRPRCKHPKKSG